MTMMSQIVLGCAAMSVALFAQTALAQHEGHDKAGLADHAQMKDGDHAQMKGGDHAQMKDGEHAEMQGDMDMAWTEPYTLDTCPVSGEKLGGEMGDAIVRTYDDREVRFCCKGCIEDFEADKAGFFKKIDNQIIADQLRYYPDVCIVSGEPLTVEGEDIAVNMVYGNRLIRFCCMDCKKDFKADPVAYIAKLDAIVAEAQRPDYPLDTCPVSGDEVGAMSDGDPAEMVIAGRLIRFCCPGCGPKVKANPTAYLAAIDKAWQAKGMYMPTAMADADHDGMMPMDGDAHGMHDAMKNDDGAMQGRHGGHNGHGDHGDHDH